VNMDNDYVTGKYPVIGATFVVYLENEFKFADVDEWPRETTCVARNAVTAA
jgi:hypothetical protein